MRELLSPKQVARAIGVSESSLKRWCDQGLLATVRTAGGHRRLALSEVLRFVRDHDHKLVAPEALGLHPSSQHSERGIERGRSQLVEALLAGDEGLCRQIVMDLFLARHSLATICDQVIAAAFRDIGDKWECHEAEVYQDRRGCEIAVRMLHELRQTQGSAQTGLTAIGGSIEGDQYVIPTTMAELVLRDAGWNATSLGTSLPFATLVNAVQDTRPRLVWISVSHLTDEDAFVQGFGELHTAATERGAALVVGGRVMADAIRKRLRYSAFCDTMQHLEDFARALACSATFPAETIKGAAPEGTTPLKLN